MLAVLVLAFVASVLTGPRVGAIVEALTPPRLPPVLAVAAPVAIGNQNWTPDQAEEFHFKAQGTHTLPIPLPWLLALEEPVASPFSIPFAKRGRFVDDSYLLRFGFIGAVKSRHNPDGLPIGFAITPFQTLDGLSKRVTAVGLTCAACHTGQLVLDGKRYVVEGGPAVTDLGQLTAALGAALGQTAVSEKLPFLGGRFDRFARAVLNAEYSDAARNQLADDLDSVVKALASQPNGIAVTEGFTRLDALNRIGNQVFALDTKRYGNYVDINAPVNFPHIWTSSWFDWVQYDGSIMQPLVRNAGEAMGVRAQVVFNAQPGHGAFSSSIPFDNLDWIETLLAGERNPYQTKSFGGLHAPSWPGNFPPIDLAKSAAGAKLYAEHCTECHRPALTRKVVRGEEREDLSFWDYFKPIRWRDGDGAVLETKNHYFQVKMMSQKDIGADAAQGEVLAKRKIDTAGSVLTRAGEYGPGLGLETEVCQARKNDLPEIVKVTDGAMLDYPTALGAAVQMAIAEWAQGKPKSQTEAVEAKVKVAGYGRTADKPPATANSTFEEDRPNCLQAGAGYKARPLNGVWATAPFLHNGSVPTLYDMLRPASERPKSFLLGDPTFDPKNVGLRVHEVEPRGRLYDDNGYFILDTSRSGNRNTGHEFVGNHKKEERPDGVIGRALSDEERYAIIEFLKTL